jgi:hypothetical protein
MVSTEGLKRAIHFTPTQEAKFFEFLKNRPDSVIRIVRRISFCRAEQILLQLLLFASKFKSIRHLWFLFYFIYLRPFTLV